MDFTKQFLTILVWVLGIAAVSIGIEAYNRHEEYKKNNQSSFNFLVLVLVGALVGLIYTGYSMYITNKIKYMTAGANTLAGLFTVPA